MPGGKQSVAAPGLPGAATVGLVGDCAAFIYRRLLSGFQVFSAGMDSHQRESD